MSRPDTRFGSLNLAFPGTPNLEPFVNSHRASNQIPLRPLIPGMLRNASRASSRALTNTRCANQAYLTDFVLTSFQSASSSSRFVGRRSVDSQPCMAINSSAYRFYSTSSTKGVKETSNEDQNLPPTLKGTSTSTNNGSASSAKKHVEPRLAPRKPDSTVSSTQSHVQLQSQASRTSKSSSNASSQEKEPPTSSPADNPSMTAVKNRISKPHLIQPIELDDPGIIKTALNDIDDALSNGTLQPLPADLAARTTTTHNIGGMTFNADTGRVWWHKLKEMTKFYFFGVVKLGREHRVIATDVRRRLKESEQKGLNGVSEWRDKEYLTTYKMDLLRLVPFVSIIVILEEVLPLVIIYAPFLLPSTCKLPSQARRIEDLGDKKRWDSLISLGKVLQLREELDPALNSNAGLPLLGHEQGTAEGRLDRLPEGSIQLLCRLLGITPYGPSPYLKLRLRSTLAKLAEEDKHFSTSKPSSVTTASDPISQLSLGELRTVLGRRGFPNTPLTLPQLRQNLQWWLAYPEHSVEKRLGAVLELARWSTYEPKSPSLGKH